MPRHRMQDKNRIKKARYPIGDERHDAYANKRRCWVFGKREMESSRRNQEQGQDNDPGGQSIKNGCQDQSVKFKLGLEADAGDMEMI